MQLIVDQHGKRYITLSTDFLMDSRLSLEAIGLFARLVALCNAGGSESEAARDLESRRRAIENLMQSGYLIQSGEKITIADREINHD